MGNKREKIIFSSLFVFVCIVLYLVLFFPPHMGAANNGDFYRMAERCSVNGVELFTGDEYPFFSKVYEKWQWKKMDWLLLTPVKQSYGNIWPIMLVRLLTDIISDTETEPFSTYYLALVYAVMFLVATALLIKFVIRIMPRGSIILGFASIVVFMGSMHLAWFNSFYGEAMLYVGLFLSLGLFCQLIYFHHTPVSTIFLLLSTCFCSFMFLTGKPQNVIAWPFWAIMMVITAIYVYRQVTSDMQKRKRRTIGVVCTIIVSVYIAYSGAACYKLYQWNGELNEKDTLYNAIMHGALELTNSEEETQTMLKEMGLAPELALDKGNQAYLQQEEYNFIIPGSEKAQRLLYDKINTFKLLKFYITHPKYLYKALEVTASCAIRPFTWLLMFVQDTPETTGKGQQRFALWERLRPLFVPHHFWQYVIIYLVLFGICIRKLLCSETESRCKVLV